MQYDPSAPPELSPMIVNGRNWPGNADSRRIGKGSKGSGGCGNKSFAGIAANGEAAAAYPMFHATPHAPIYTAADKNEPEPIPPLYGPGPCPTPPPATDEQVEAICQAICAASEDCSRHGRCCSTSCVWDTTACTYDPTCETCGPAGPKPTGPPISLNPFGV